MYTVVPKYPKNEVDRDPFPFLDGDKDWGLTDEEFKLKYAGGKYRRRREREELLRLIIKEMRGEYELG